MKTGHEQSIVVVMCVGKRELLRLTRRLNGGWRCVLERWVLIIKGEFVYSVRNKRVICVGHP
jgi:hypothetical protein